MKIAALYDIHGNLPALEAVLTEIATIGVDKVIVGGDVVVGEDSRACLERVLNLPYPTQFIRGNCEDAVVACVRGADPGALPEAALAQVEAAADSLTSVQADILAAWPMTVELLVPGLGTILFCHATPRSTTEIFTAKSDEGKLRRIFADVAADLVVCGHTHVQFDRRFGDIRIVNAGSVGMPFEGRWAYWLLVEGGVEFRRSGFD